MINTQLVRPYLRKAWSGSKPWASRRRRGWAWEHLDRRSPGSLKRLGANLVVVGHRPSGPLARWLFGSVGTYLVKHLRCSVLIAQTEISDDQFAQLTVAAAQA